MDDQFNKLVKLVFYDDLTSKGDNHPKMRKTGDRGIAVVVLDAFTKFNLFVSCISASEDMLSVPLLEVSQQKAECITTKERK